MNRGLLLGLAVCLALLGISLIGGDNQAYAGHGCGGCGGWVACGGPVACCGVPCGGVVVGKAVVDCGCAGVVTCVGRPRPRLFGCGLFRHRRVACGCDGYVPVADCCGVVVGKGVVSYGPVQKGGAVQKVGPVQKEGPVQKGGALQKDSAAQKVTTAAAPFAYYQMGFRRR